MASGVTQPAHSFVRGNAARSSSRTSRPASRSFQAQVEADPLVSEICNRGEIISTRDPSEPMVTTPVPPTPVITTFHVAGGSAALVTALILTLRVARRHALRPDPVVAVPSAASARGAQTREIARIRLTEREAAIRRRFSAWCEQLSQEA